MCDITGFLIFFTLYISDLLKYKVNQRTGRFYDFILIISCITIIFRVLYQILLRTCTYSFAIEILIRILIYLALMCRVLVYSLGALFAFSATGLLPLLRRKDFQKLIIFLFYLIPNLYIIVDIFNQMMFSLDNSMNLVWYRSSLLLDITIIIQHLYCISIIMIYRRLLSKRRILYTLVMLPLNIVVLIFQMFFPSIQIEMFIVAITCYLIFATIQRPEILVNTQTLALSNIAFEKELKKSVRIELPVKIIFIKITNEAHLNMYLGPDRFIEFLKSVTSFLNTLSKKAKLKASVYYLNNFVYALPTENQTDEAINVQLNELEKYFSQSFILGKAKINLITKICVVCYPEDVDTADKMLYAAKNFDSIITKTNKPYWYRDYSGERSFIIKSNMEKILDRAIENRLFDVYYQPIFNVETMTFTCAEALIRLNDEEFGIIPPATFISYAERTNRIHIIGDFVLENVCSFLASKEAASLNLEYIDINLSITQSLQNNLVEKIRSYLEKYDIAPSKLRLEVTEKAVNFNPVIVEKNINQLVNMGIRLALDDYGTDYSNIRNVISLPFDIIKLNKTFVDEVDNSENLSVVKDTIHMLRSLGKEVIIEGIESKERAELFRNYKIDKHAACKYLQGFYFSHPLPQSEFVKFFTI